ncbi:MAG: FtsQ-type POTRA domain-containing protein [bacterium]|nr:FtsQ-type POTRA domain-containing protein [bacterium]
MQRIYGKPRRIRKNTPFWRKKYLLVVLLITFVLGGLGYVFLFSPIFQLQAREVRGARTVAPQALLDMTPVQGNLLFISEKPIEKNILSTFPEIGRAQVKKNFLFRKLIIDVVEREEFVLSCSIDGRRAILPCVAADSQGVGFREKQEIPAGMPILALSEPTSSLGTKILDPNLLPFVVELKRSLDGWSVLQDTETKIEYFSLAPGLVSAHMTEGWEIYFTQEEDRSWQETKLREVLEKQIPQEKRKHLQYIDVRFGNQAYVK